MERPQARTCTSAAPKGAPRTNRAARVASCGLSARTLPERARAYPDKAPPVIEVDRARVSARTRWVQRGVSPAGQRRKGKRRGAGSGAGTALSRPGAACGVPSGSVAARRGGPGRVLGCQAGGRLAERHAGRARRAGAVAVGATAWVPRVGLVSVCFSGANDRPACPPPTGVPGPPCRREGRVRVRRCFRQRRPKACGPGRGARKKRRPAGKPLQGKPTGQSALPLKRALTER